MHQDGCFWGQLYFRNIPQWLLLKRQLQRYINFRNSGYTFYIFLLSRHVKEKRIFMNNFLSEGFSEKCKHTELALNFIQKQCFS